MDSTEAADRLRMLLEAVVVYREPSSQVNAAALVERLRVIVFVNTTQALLQALKDLDDVIVTRSVSLVVVDSIASLVRKASGASVFD